MTQENKEIYKLYLTRMFVVLAYGQQMYPFSFPDGVHSF